MVKNSKATIKDELRRLREIERHIDKLERERSRLEVRLVKDAGGIGPALKRKHTKSVSTYALSRFKKKKMIYFIVTSLGAVILWVGAWGVIEKYVINPWIAVFVGLAIIWLTRKYD